MLPPPIIEVFARAGQGHVFAFFDGLDPAAQARLLAQAAEVDLAELDRLTRSLLAAAGPGGRPAAAGPDLTGLAPAPFEARPEHGGDAAAWAAARAAGEAALRAGRVAAFTVAGGQGTRLGFEGPKGTFPVTPVPAQAALPGVRGENPRGRPPFRPSHPVVYHDQPCQP